MGNLVAHQRMRFRVRGQVQGVGFRPFVYRLARELGLTGWVTNDTDGVVIEVQGPPESLGAFAGRLKADRPPLAEIRELCPTDQPAISGEEAFRVLPSRGGRVLEAQVAVDTATCDDCLRELQDPGDPRYRYPFINCTNCGPRYTIVRHIPYDRANTTMAGFAMCPLCAREYGDPANRRFHAQPVACPVCGPKVWLADPQGQAIERDDPIAGAARELLAGWIVAIKGLGGFHLACRADDEAVVRRLRQRKAREAKPFALMVASPAMAETLCDVAGAREWLTGPVRPIVLLRRRPGARIADAVAEGLDCLGVMLPYTPLHHLLFSCAGMAEVPLVMTSGNRSDEPLAKDNDDALARLGPIADALLLHDRPIERRIDDSIVRVATDQPVAVVRRARGLAPRPIDLGPLQFEAAPVLAVGAELKNTVCLLAHRRALLSEHIGDLTDARMYRHYVQTISHLEGLFEFEPAAFAVDLHPAYLSTGYALRRQRREQPDASIVRVQHHHAHIAACLAENGQAGPVIGLACDGVGYGADGAAWGGEILQADLREFHRLGHLAYLPLIGGDAAARQTYRPALAALYQTFGPDCRNLPILARLAVTDQQIDASLEMLTREAGCVPSSSLGRWFDAVAALAGLVGVNRYEAEAAMRLESAIEPGVTASYPFALAEGDVFRIDLRPMVAGIVADLDAGRSVGHVAAAFHNTVVEFLLAAAAQARQRTGLSAVALSGGCFANAYLLDHLSRRLHEAGFEVLTHRQVPCNDGGVALGQAVVAAARLGDLPRQSIESAGDRAGLASSG